MFRLSRVLVVRPLKREVLLSSSRCFSSSSSPPSAASSPPEHSAPASSPPAGDSAAVLDSMPVDSWHPFDLVSQLVHHVHLAADVPYWAAILGTSVGIRLLASPLAIKGIQNSARMAVLRPQMKKIEEYSKANPNDATYRQEMFLLWKKHNVNPLKALLVPLVQLPLFVTFFMGIRQMGTYYPGITEGGCLWFPDLSVHDPTFVLPILNGVSFLMMVEMGSQEQQGSSEFASNFKTAMRGLALFMVPLTMYTPASVFMYWIPNSVVSLLQTQVLKTNAMRKAFDIPDPPVEAPSSTKQSAFSKLQNAFKSSFKSRKSGDVEVIDGAAEESKSKPEIQVPKSPPPTTYAQPPPSKRTAKKKNKK